MPTWKGHAVYLLEKRYKLDNLLFVLSIAHLKKPMCDNTKPTSKIRNIMRYPIQA